MTEISRSTANTDVFSMPCEQEREVGTDLENALAAAVLRLEEESQNRRHLSRNSRLRSLEMKHRAILKGKEAARSKKIANMVGSSVQLASSALSAVGAFAGGGGENGVDKGLGNAGGWMKGATAALETGGEIARDQFHHRSSLESLEADAMKAGAEGMSGVAGDHASAHDEAERSVERARNLLARVIDGAHAQRMAALRG